MIYSYANIIQYINTSIYYIIYKHTLTYVNLDSRNLGSNGELHNRAVLTQTTFF